jgi:hypothetical protein
MVAPTLVALALAEQTMAEIAQNRPKRPTSRGTLTARQSRKRQPSRT